MQSRIRYKETVFQRSSTLISTSDVTGRNERGTQKLKLKPSLLPNHQRSNNSEDKKFIQIMLVDVLDRFHAINFNAKWSSL